MKAKFFPTVLLTVAFLISACGPQATPIPPSAPPPTAVPSTATPIPPSPTPIPFDLTVTVVDEQGAPVAWANVTLDGIGEPIAADESGQASWNALPQASVTAHVIAMGYAPVDQEIALTPGLNESTISLPRDPFGLLPSDACGAGESMLYADDFQDGEAQGWNFDQKNPDAHLVGPAPDAEANSVLTYDATKISYYGNDAYLGGNLNETFGDAVWRMRFLVTRPTAPSFIWHGSGPLEYNGQQYTHAQYDLYFAGGISQLILNRSLESGPNVVVPNPKLASTTFNQVGMQWYQMEFSTYQGHIQLWIDGKMVMEYTDAAPLPPGNMGIWIGAFTDKSLTVLYFDDVRVCGLSAPFTSIFTPAP